MSLFARQDDFTHDYMCFIKGLSVNMFNKVQVDPCLCLTSVLMIMTCFQNICSNI